MAQIFIGNNNKISGSTIGSSCISNNQIMINGEIIPPPPKQKGSCNSVTIIDNKVYVNGYEYKNGKWQKTFNAFIHKWF
jgi:hypothetical protein